MKVLLLAEACNPEMSSEPLIGFNACMSITKHVDEAIIVTAIRNKKAIEKANTGKARFIFIDNEKLSYMLWKLTRLLRLGADFKTVIRLPLFYSFEKAVLQLLKNELKNETFDIIHRVTPISAAIPSWLAPKISVPYIIGPINGGLPYPPGFKKLQLGEKELLRPFRFFYRLLPGSEATFKCSSIILASFPHTVRTIPQKYHHKIIDVPENGVDPNRFFASTQEKDRKKCLFLFVGRLVPFKCPTILLHAIKKSKILRQHELIFIGDGPEKERMEAFVKKNNLANTVKFLGNIPQKDVAEYMRKSDIFVFPSVRDSGAGVLAEAMMSGLCCVTVDYGPAEALLDQASGIKIPLGSFNELVDRFCHIMEDLVNSPEKIRRYSEAGKIRAQKTLDWDTKGRKIREIYDGIYDSSVKIPNFYV